VGCLVSCGLLFSDSDEKKMRQIFFCFSSAPPSERAGKKMKSQVTLVIVFVFSVQSRKRNRFREVALFF